MFNFIFLATAAKKGSISDDAADGLLVLIAMPIICIILIVAIGLPVAFIIGGAKIIGDAEKSIIAEFIGCGALGVFLDVLIGILFTLEAVKECKGTKATILVALAIVGIIALLVCGIFLCTPTVSGVSAIILGILAIAIIGIGTFLRFRYC